MNKHEKLLKIQSLLETKSKEETVFEIKTKNINDEIYAKHINPLLINYLNMSEITQKIVHTKIKEIDGYFTSGDLNISVDSIKTAINLANNLNTDFLAGLETEIDPLTNLETEIDFEQVASEIDFLTKSLPDPNFEQAALISYQNTLTTIFDIIGAKRKNITLLVKKDDICSFLEILYEYIQYKNFSRYESFKTGIFNTHLKPLTNEKTFEILKTPFELLGMKILGIWKILESSGLESKIDEPSLLLGHCTRAHANCWPIIVDGLKMAKSCPGRCGRGIYFSNDISKCLQYSHTVKNESNTNYGVIFLAQVWLGKVCIQTTNCKKPPDYDSVHALGTVSPNITKTIYYDDSTSSEFYIDEPKPTGIMSSFANNEFIIYNEERCKLRFVVLYQNHKNIF